MSKGWLCLTVQEHQGSLFEGTNHRRRYERLSTNRGAALKAEMDEISDTVKKLAPTHFVS
jgi:hypothetical protein